MSTTPSLDSITLLERLPELKETCYLGAPVNCKKIKLGNNKMEEMHRASKVCGREPRASTPSPGTQLSPNTSACSPTQTCQNPSLLGWPLVIGSASSPLSLSAWWSGGGMESSNPPITRLVLLASRPHPQVLSQSRRLPQHKASFFFFFYFESSGSSRSSGNCESWIMNEDQIHRVRQK